MNDPRPTLPIDPYLAEIAAALAQAPAVILKAEPGAGKTTRVPPALLPVIHGKIIVLEPRRLAARLSAERVAAERGESAGQTVGYQIRFESRTSAATRLLFVTEGVFLRMALDDPKLTGIGAVLIDEFHERHIHTDLALAIVRSLQRGPRPDLKLAVMSATLDTGALAAYMPEAPRFDVPGRTFSVAIEYLAPAPDAPVEEAVAAGVARALADPRSPGDVLVFLTGIAEIRRCAGRLARLAAEAGAEVLLLAADLPLKEQQRVFSPSSRRKVVLATNVAETSLTLPGVTAVVDAGKAKIAGHAAWSGMPTLDVKRVSQASCIQRAGRAGRVAKGVTYRLYSEADYLSRPPFTPPDIQRLDLAETYLDVLAFCRVLGESPKSLAAALPWFEAPAAESESAALQLLQLVGALDGEGRLTPRGAQLARLPLHPRLAAIVVKGQELGVASAALAAAFLVGERGIMGRGPALSREASDVHFQLDILAKIAAGQQLGSRSLAEAVDMGRARQILSLHDQLASRLGIRRALVIQPETLAICLLAGFPDRVAKRRPPQKDGAKELPLYNFCMGRGGILGETSVVRDEELIVVLDAAETSARSADRGTAIYLASGVTPAALHDAPSGLLGSAVQTVWADQAERVDVLDRITYGQLVVSESRVPVTPAHQAVIEEMLRVKLAERWPKPFPDASDLDTYHERARLLGTPLPRFEGEMLELLQAAICEGRRSFKEIAERSLLSYIEDQLPYEAAQQLRQGAPLEVRLGNGRVLKVTYETGRPPFVTGFIQDFFGTKVTPSLPAGAALTIHLLGPNKRPLQVTGDLPGFWQRHYPAVRAELGRKYPRHHWPEQPESAEPVLHKARAKK